jgi:hypothetical protein
MYSGEYDACDCLPQKVATSSSFIQEQYQVAEPYVSLANKHSNRIVAEIIIKDACMCTKPEGATPTHFVLKLVCQAEPSPR